MKQTQNNQTIMIHTEFGQLKTNKQTKKTSSGWNVACHSNAQTIDERTTLKQSPSINANVF